MGMILYLLEQKALFIQKTIKEVNNRQNRWLYKKYISNRWLVNVINVENKIDFHQKINEEIEYLSKEKKQKGIPLYGKTLPFVYNCLLLIITIYLNTCFRTCLCSRQLHQPFHNTLHLFQLFSRDIHSILLDLEVHIPRQT